MGGRYTNANGFVEVGLPYAAHAEGGRVSSCVPWRMSLCVRTAEREELVSPVGDESQREGDRQLTGVGVTSEACHKKIEQEQVEQRLHAVDDIEFQIFPQKRAR